MSDDHIIGGVAVRVTADLTEYEAGLARAKGQAQAFDQQATAAMSGVSRATADLTAGEKRLLEQLLAVNTSQREAASYFGKTAESQRLLAAYTNMVADAHKSAAQAAGQRAAAEATVNAATGSGADRLANDRAGLEQLRLNMALTRQRFAEQATLEAGATAFNMRMSKQRAGTAIEEAERAAKAEQSTAATTLAFQRRMTAQRATEARTATTAAEREDQRITAAMAAQAGGNFRVQTNQLRGLTPTGGIPAAEKSAKESAKAFEDLLPPLSKAEKAAAGVEKAVHGASGALGSSRAVTEGAAMVSEVLSGRFNRLAGSATVLARYSGALPFILSPVGLAIGGVAAATIAATAATIAYANSQEHLANVAAGAGRRSGLSASQMDEASRTASQQSGQSQYGTRATVEAMAEAGVRSEQTAESIARLTAAYARLTDQKPAKAQEEIAKAMEDTRGGVKGAQAAIEIFQKRFGDFNDTQKQAIITAARFGDVQKVQDLLWKSVAADIESANRAGNATPTIWDKIASSFLGVAFAAGKAGEGLAAIAFYGDPSSAAYMRAQEAAKAASRTADAKAKAARAALTGQQDQAEEAHLSTPEGREEENFNQLRGNQARARQGVQASLKLGDTATAARYQADLEKFTDAIGRVTDAKGKYITVSEREHQIVQLQVQETEAVKHHDAALRGAIASKIAYLKAGDAPQSNAEVRRHAADEGALAAAHGMRSSPRTNSFARQDNSKSADAEAELNLADAYLKSDSAAIRAEATRKAVTEATRAGRTATEAAKLAQDELNLAIGKAASDGAKRAMDLQREATAQDAINAALAKGDIGKKEAARKMQVDIETAHLQAEADIAVGHQKEVLLRVIEALGAAYDKAAASKDDFEAAGDLDKDKGEIAMLQLKLSLIHATARARDVAVARLQTTTALGGPDEVAKSPLKQQAVDSAGNLAGAKSDFDSATAFEKTTAAVQKEIDAFRKQADTLGMTRAKAASYEEMLKLVEEATRDGSTITDQQRAKLQGLATAYGSASAAADKFKERQKGAQEASKAMADGVESNIEAMIYDGEKWNVAVRNLSQSFGRAALKGALTGEGPLAGLMGTAQSNTVGGPNGGVLSQLFGNALGVGKGGANKPSGAMGDPLHVIMDTAAGMASGAQGLLGGLFGGGGGGGAGSAFSDGSPVGMMAGLFHTGTSHVGTPHRQIPVSPALFLNAPRLHSGLAPDEFPAILQEGEGVTAKGGKPRSRAGDVHIHVSTPDSASFGRSRGQIQREMKRSTR